MTLGAADRQGNLLDDMTQFCDRTLAKDSIYAFLHRERERLFPDEAFADLFTEDGRRSVPPSIVAAVMVLQRLEGLSDREAVDRYAFDARRRYASGVGSYDTGGWATFSHTVLVDMRERLRGSERPDRVFEIALDAAKQAGLVGKARARLDAALRRGRDDGHDHAHSFGDPQRVEARRRRTARRAAGRAHERGRLRELGQAADRLG